MTRLIVTKNPQKTALYNRNPPNLLADEDVSVGDDHDGDEDIYGGGGPDEGEVPAAQPHRVQVSEQRGRGGFKQSFPPKFKETKIF